MTPPSDAQKQLLFDYSLGLTCQCDTAEAEQLLSSSEEAEELVALLKSALSPLDSLEPEPCPDELAQRTILRLKEQAAIVSGRSRLEQLLSAERAGAAPLRIPFWRNWTEVAAVAAILVLFIGVLFPAFGFARQKQWQSHCQSHLASIYGGAASYMSDHDGRFPMVATVAGSPWWKVGMQGPENHSNTRRVWLLVGQEYTRPAMYICPARRGGGRVDLETLDVAKYDDFPDRSCIHFSIRVDCPQSSEPGQRRKRVFLADLNPLSEEFPQDLSSSPSIELCESLLTSNSRNHRQRGQNVLLCDGSVEFTKTRHASVSDDDIYTLQAMCCGQKVRGYERPSSDNDTFVAP
jgi:hypothetical protein